MSEKKKNPVYPVVKKNVQLFVTRPYYGLHSWGSANRAWAARSHVNYGLGYTKGYRTLVVGDPPPAHPQAVIEVAIYFCQT